MKNLIVLVGATGVGKTDISIELAQWLDAPIVSSDSRQLYRQMTIGTAVPTPEQLATVQHYFIHSHDVTELYTAGRYEREVMGLLCELFQKHDNVMLVGGSGLYIDAVCNGMDAVPATNVELRNSLIERLKEKGINDLLDELEQKDPKFFAAVDRGNPNRVTRALEVILETGKPYSSFRHGEGKKREFNIIKIGVERPREQLYKRINMRVDLMMEQGLLEEVTALYPLREHNALQTVGYREFFDYIDGKSTLAEAVELLKRNTRRYAKRQTTWFGRYEDIKWFSPSDSSEIKNFLSEKMAASTTVATEIKVCIGKLCREHEGEDIVRYLEERLSGNKKYIITTCRCVGNCSMGVVLWIGEEQYERMSLEKVKLLELV